MSRDRNSSESREFTPGKGLLGVLLSLAVAAAMLWYLIIPGMHYAQYSKATQLAETENYEEAAVLFEKLGDYRDSVQQAEAMHKMIQDERTYDSAVASFNNGDYEQALAYFEAHEGEGDSSEYAQKCRDALDAVSLQQAQEAYESGDCKTALSLIEAMYNPQSEEAVNLQQLTLEKYAMIRFNVGNLNGTEDLIEQLTVKSNEIKAVEQKMATFKSRFEKYLGHWSTDPQAENAEIILSPVVKNGTISVRVRGYFDGEYRDYDGLTINDDSIQFHSSSYDSSKWYTMTIKEDGTANLYVVHTDSDTAEDVTFYRIKEYYK